MIKGFFAVDFVPEKRPIRICHDINCEEQCNYGKGTEAFYKEISYERAKQLYEEGLNIHKDYLKNKDMNSDNSKEGIKKRDELIVFFVGLVGQIIVFVLSNYISSLYSTTLNQALIISIIIISIGFICWFVVRTIIHNLKPKRRIVEGKGRNTKGHMLP